MQSLNSHFEELIEMMFPVRPPNPDQLAIMEACFMAGARATSFEIGRDPLSYIAISSELDTWFQNYKRKHGL